MCVSACYSGQRYHIKIWNPLKIVDLERLQIDHEFHYQTSSLVACGVTDK